MMWRVIKWVALVLIVGIGISAISFARSINRSDLANNKTIQFLWADQPATRWGKHKTLTPDFFEIGEDRSVVLTQILEDGFQPVLASNLNIDQNDTQQGFEYFSREANRFPCNVKAYVMLQFDQSDRLLFGQASLQERGCL